MMLKVIFYSIISIVGISLIMYFSILFSRPTPETKIKINKHEISTKLSSINQPILIPKGHKISSVYLLEWVYFSSC